MPAPGAAAPITGVHQGILGCPTVDLPSYGAASAAALSEPFRTSCATCHGGNGAGTDKYPALPGTLTEAAFIEKVRKGYQAMPAFAADFVTDAQLEADYAALKTLSAGRAGGVASGGTPETWSAAKLADVLKQGLATWRKAGSVDGQACTNCHSSDGVELAIIGFSDDAILRRAQQHLSPADALVVRDFVHAQRRAFAIARPCSTDWRPFQPGGAVLPGNTKEEQDLSFLKELQKRKLLVAYGSVTSLDDANRALGELQQIDLRALPIGIPLPHWSEDKFNGPASRDINDYMPAVPTIPNRPAEYFTKEDAYLANPTDAGLYALIKEQKSSMNDGGYAAKNALPLEPGANCPRYDNSTTWVMRNLVQPKRQSVLMAAHVFRQELAKPGSWLARPRSPFPDAPETINPMFFLGGESVEPPCYSNVTYPTWIKSLPEAVRGEFPQSDLDAGIIDNATNRITHPWMMLGQVLDQTLMSTQGDSGNKTHYWAFRNFVQKDVHLPFLYTHRLAVQIQYWTKLQGTPTFPQHQGPYGIRADLHPLLGSNNQLKAGFETAIAVSTGRPEASAINKLRGNLMRMLLLLARDLLSSGAAIPAEQGYDHCQSVTCDLEGFVGYLDALDKLAANETSRAAMAAQGFDLALYKDDTRKVWADVMALLKAAPRK